MKQHPTRSRLPMAGCPPLQLSASEPKEPAYPSIFWKNRLFTECSWHISVEENNWNDLALPILKNVDRLGHISSSLLMSLVPSCPFKLCLLPVLPGDAICQGEEYSHLLAVQLARLSAPKDFTPQHGRMPTQL